MSEEEKRLMVDWSLDHPNQLCGHYLLKEVLAISDNDFYGEFMTQLLRAATRGPEVSGSAVNFIISVIKGIGPRDQLEAMLAAQMGAVHALTMEFARRLNSADNIPQQDSAERTFNKLARTFAAQAETLRRLRTGGTQHVVVQHVSVGEGGQAAVVGSVNGGAGVAEKRETTS